MKIVRRTMLALLGASSLTVLRSGVGLGAMPDAKPLFVILDDLTAQTQASSLNAILEPFANLQIPVGFIVKPSGPGAPDSKNNGIENFLHDFMSAHSGLGEVIAWAPDAAAAPPYFQARKATQARADLENFLGWPTEKRPDALYPLTIAGYDPDGDLATEGMRAAGFRNIILLSENSRFSVSERCGQTMPCVRGSLRHAITDRTEDILASVKAAIENANMALLVLSLKPLADISLDDLRRRAFELADAIGVEMQTDRIFVSLPREHIFWFTPPITRLTGLIVAAPSNDGELLDTGFATFKAALIDAAIPFSVLGQTAPHEMGSSSKCLVVSEGSVPIDFGEASCDVADLASPKSLARLADAGVEIIVHPAGAGGNGIDDTGVLHLSENLSIPDGVVDFSEIAPSQDIVISLKPEAYGFAADRAAVIEMLLATKNDSESVIVDIPDFARAILPNDPAYRVMLATRHSLHVELAAGPPVAEPDRSALMEDAWIAWSYFEKTTDPSTGLCPATVAFGDGGSSFYRVLTMWDYASLIHAMIASHEIGLIDDISFLMRTEALLRGLPAKKIGGLMLPSSEISTASGNSMTLDYNACDTGRLLSALAALDQYPVSKGLAAASVAKWDLDGTIHDGRLNSIESGKFVPFYRSHCTHYASRAFGLWGLMAASPYNVMKGDSATDARMSLLYEVVEIGALGAEPLLLEAMEFGLSEPSAYLADVLFTAQTRHYAATNELMCPSEVAMDRSPWFTYQGFRVDAAHDPWDVRAMNPAPIYSSQDFRTAARVISTKAAFLWAATRPGAYASLLLDYVRQRARASEAGYSSGIYTATGTAMNGYSDINTNGVILQSIAYTLRGSVPQLSGPL